MPQTGPKTNEGLKKSSQNAIVHGLTSKARFLLPHETQEAWDALHQSWTSQLQPRTDAERSIVEDIVHAEWGLRRCRANEANLLEREMMDQTLTLQGLYGWTDAEFQAASAFKTLADNSKALDLLHRYMTRHRRAIDRGIATLRSLRAFAPEATRETRHQETRPQETPPHEARQPQPAAPQNELLLNETVAKLAATQPSTPSRKPAKQILQNERPQLRIEPEKIPSPDSTPRRDRAA